MIAMKTQLASLVALSSVFALSVACSDEGEGPADGSGGGGKSPDGMLGDGGSGGDGDGDGDGDAGGDGLDGTEPFVDTFIDPETEEQGEDYSITLLPPNGYRIPKLLGASGDQVITTGFDYFDWYGITHHRTWFRPTFSELADNSSVTSAEAFASASEAVRQDPLRQATGSDYFIDWENFHDRMDRDDMPELMSYFQERGIESLIINTRYVSETPIAGDWVSIFRQWKHWYALVYHLASEYDITMYSFRNEPHAATDYDTWESHWLASADAMQKAMIDVNEDFGKSLELQIAGPTAPGVYWNYDLPDPYVDFHGWGSVSWAKVKFDIYGNYDANNPWNYGLYDYHRYGDNGRQSTNIILGARSDIATANNDPHPDIPIVITEYNTSTGGSFNSNLLDTEDLHYGTSMAQILEATAPHGPDGLGDDGGFFIFKLGASQEGEGGGEGEEPLVGVGNKLSYVSQNAPYNYGGVTRGGASFQMYARHFRGGKPLVPVSVTAGEDDWRRTVAVLDEEVGAYYVYGSNLAGSDAVVSIDFAALNVDAGAIATVQRVDEFNTGQVTERRAVSNEKGLRFFAPDHTAFLVKVPVAGTVHDQWTVELTDDSAQSVVASEAQGAAETMNISMHHSDAAARQVGLLRFRSTSPETLGRALLKLSGRNTGSDANEREILHVYAVSNQDWNEETPMTWEDAPGLGKYHQVGDAIEAPLGNADGTGDMVDIEDNYAGFSSGAGTGLGLHGQFLGAISFSSSEYETDYLDVTDYLEELAEGQSSLDVTFVVARIVRYNVNEYQNSYYTLGDYHYDGRVVEIATKEHSDAQLQPMLICSGVN